MVRKTLEELCNDKGAKGGNLKERIKALGGAIVLPTELLTGADNLRLLGNDAAHIESQEYQQVGKEEVELAIEFAKALILMARDDRYFPKRPRAQINFLADSIAALGTVSPRRSRDICMQERMKAKRAYRIIRYDYYVGCSCGYEGPAKNRACRKCGATIPPSLFG